MFMHTNTGKFFTPILTPTQNDTSMKFRESNPAGTSKIIRNGEDSLRFVE